MRGLIVSIVALAFVGPSLARAPAAAPPASRTAPPVPVVVPPSTVSTLTIEVLAPTRRMTLASRGLALAGAHVRQLGGTREIVATRAFVRSGSGTATLFFAHLIPAGRYTLATRYRVVDAQAPAPGCLPSMAQAEPPRVRCVGAAVDYAREPGAWLPALAPSVVEG